FFSCNGVSSAKLFAKVPDLNALWRQMLGKHRQALAAPQMDLPGGYHLLVGGGDQIYADSLWETVPELRAHQEMTREERIKAKTPKGFEAKMVGAYVRLYAQRWSQAEPAACLARIPSFFTWDDHDIFDGWGSYEPALQSSPFFQAVFSAANKTYTAFQLG